jgi:hypothetical protein
LRRPSSIFRNIPTAKQACIAGDSFGMPRTALYKQQPNTLRIACDRCVCHAMHKPVPPMLLCTEPQQSTDIPRCVWKCQVKCHPHAQT